jgi:hypothetical protein
MEELPTEPSESPVSAVTSTLPVSRPQSRNLPEVNLLGICSKNEAHALFELYG